ncbi:hypothetical protein PybrP1_009077 [[Pythium] brassicae (nom. inval.)]|nr:hypothetical protein PybrP1_009077 [[Pythium] brassicae (nom. inval.)]
MAQPIPFHDPNAPFHPQQQRQRPGSHAPSPAFNYGGAPAANAPPAPQFHSQPQPARRPQPHQFHQRAPQSQPFYTGGSGSQDGFYNPPAPHEFGQQQQQQQPLSSQGFIGQPQGFQQQQQYAPQQQQQPGFGFGGAPTFQSPPGSQGAQPRMMQPQQPDFINQISTNPMAGLAMNTAQDFLHKQSAIYLPGAYGVWGSLKYYFTVNNSYVKSRLKILLFPFWHKNWRRLGASENNDANKPMQYAPPSRDINAPDLYIPLMGFLTYILIVGYSKGTSNQFSPDVIGKDASYCLVMQLVEIGVLAACLYLLNSSVAFWDLVSFSGYKYIPLVVNTVVYQLLGPIAYYVALLYTGIAVSFFTLNCMKGSVAEPTEETRTFRNYLLFGVSCLQLVLVCWISYTTAPRQ